MFFILALTNSSIFHFNPFKQVEKLTRELNLDNDALNKVSSLLLHEFNQGLGKDTNKDAIVKMFPTFVRDVPDGTGKFSGAFFFKFLWKFFCGFKVFRTCSF